MTLRCRIMDILRSHGVTARSLAREMQEHPQALSHICQSHSMPTVAKALRIAAAVTRVTGRAYPVEALWECVGQDEVAA